MPSVLALLSFAKNHRFGLSFKPNCGTSSTCEEEVPANRLLAVQGTIFRNRVEVRQIQDRPP